MFSGAFLNRLIGDRIGESPLWIGYNRRMPGEQGPGAVSTQFPSENSSAFRALVRRASGM